MCNLCFSFIVRQLIVFFHFFFFFFFWSSVQFGFGLTAACWEVIQTHLVVLQLEMKLAAISPPDVETFRAAHKVSITVKAGLKNTDSKPLWCPSKVSTLHKSRWKMLSIFIFLVPFFQLWRVKNANIQVVRFKLYMQPSVNDTWLL